MSHKCTQQLWQSNLYTVALRDDATLETACVKTVQLRQVDGH